MAAIDEEVVMGMVLFTTLCLLFCHTEDHHTHTQSQSVTLNGKQRERVDRGPQGKVSTFQEAISARHQLSANGIFPALVAGRPVMALRNHAARK